jgi:hypothetical protein
MAEKRKDHTKGIITEMEDQVYNTDKERLVKKAEKEKLKIQVNKIS